MKCQIPVVACVCLCFLTAPETSRAEQQARPNVVFILADDK